MPASQRSLLLLPITALILIVIGCQPGDTADVDRSDTTTARASGTDTDTASITITKAPDNAVVCGVDSLDLSPGGGGGTVSLPPHGHQLEVRANSVPAGEKVRFTIRDLRKPYVAVDVSARPDVTFDQPVRLRLSYADCTVPKMAGLAIFRWELVPGGGYDWVALNSTVELDDEFVWVDLDKLSQYALGAS